MKKVILWFLILVLLAGACAALFACGGSDDPSTERSGSRDTQESGEARLEVPDKKFNTTFVIVGNMEWEAESDDTDIVAHAQYMRNTDIEEQFGVTIVGKEFQYYLIPDAVKDAAKAGDASVYDLVISQISYSSNIVLNGDCVNYYSVPYINLENPWWPATNREDLTLNDQCYMVLSDFALTSIGHTYCLYFNKKLAEKYNLGDIYKLVKDGEFTYDALLTMVQDVREDSNHDGRFNENDTYGMLYGGFTSNTTLILGFDNPVFRKDAETGDLVLSFYGDKIIKIMSKMIEFCYKTDGVLYTGNAMGNSFVNGQGIFTNGVFSSMSVDFREMNDLGILPLPKWNKKQAEYYSGIGLGTSALLIPELHGREEKMEKVGAVLETMSYLSYKDVRPVYYDKALKGKYSDTPAEAEMIDLIVKTRHTDFGCYMGFEGPVFTCQSMIVNKNKNIASVWEQNKPVYKEKLTKAFAAFGMEFDQL